MGPRRIGIVLLACALLGTAVVAQAATFTIINNDGPGEGFNDPTPVAPVGGNTGTTRGAQRLIAFQNAADIWGALLTSNVPILVNATFDPLTCGPTSAILGSAGPTTFFRDFSGAPIGSTWYPLALANAIEKLVRQPKLAQAMGKRGRAAVKRRLSLEEQALGYLRSFRCDHT